MCEYVTFQEKDSQEGNLNEFVVQKAAKRDHYQF